MQTCNVHLAKARSHFQWPLVACGSRVFTSSPPCHSQRRLLTEREPLLRPCHISVPLSELSRFGGIISGDVKCNGSVRDNWAVGDIRSHQISLELGETQSEVRTCPLFPKVLEGKTGTTNSPHLMDHGMGTVVGGSPPAPKVMLIRAFNGGPLGPRSQLRIIVTSTSLTTQE